MTISNPRPGRGPHASRASSCSPPAALLLPIIAVSVPNPSNILSRVTVDFTPLGRGAFCVSALSLVSLPTFGSSSHHVPPVLTSGRSNYLQVHTLCRLVSSLRLLFRRHDRRVQTLTLAGFAFLLEFPEQFQAVLHYLRQRTITPDNVLSSSGSLAPSRRSVGSDMLGAACAAMSSRILAFASSATLPSAIVRIPNYPSFPRISPAAPTTPSHPIASIPFRFVRVSLGRIAASPTNT